MHGLEVTFIHHDFFRINITENFLNISIRFTAPSINLVPITMVES